VHKREEGKDGTYDGKEITPQRKVRKEKKETHQREKTKQKQNERRGRMGLGGGAAQCKKGRKTMLCASLNERRFVLT